MELTLETIDGSIPVVIPSEQTMVAIRIKVNGVTFDIAPAGPGEPGITLHVYGRAGEQLHLRPHSSNVVTLLHKPE